MAIVAPTNTVTKERNTSIQFIHYPGLVAGASDFDQVSNAAALGNFLNGAANNGDQTTYDYVDLQRSMKQKYAKKLEIYVEASATTELWIRINPIYKYPDQGMRRGSDVDWLESPFNKGWDKSDDIHRIVVTASTPVTYVIEGVAIEGFNIDYNGTASGAGTPNVDTLIITCT